jgi:predicted acylesterase/phospholipase RssA
MPVIKNLVCSGGGQTFFQVLGAIQYLEENLFLDINNIESIYGTSAGSVMGVILCLKFDWETLNNYFLNRPWQDVFPLKINHLVEAYGKRGVFDISHIKRIFQPLFNAKNISLDITLEEFYQFCKIDSHFLVFDVNQYKVIEISHNNYPNLSLMEAILMSVAIPGLFTPVFLEDKCLMDAGIAVNYPLNFCLDSGKKEEETLGFKNIYSSAKNSISTDSNLYDFLLTFFFKAVFSLSTDSIQPKIKYEVLCETDYLTLQTLTTTLYNQETRVAYYNIGIESAKKFLADLEYGI